MKWSAKLGRFAGIDVYVHVTFLLLLAWFAYVSWMSTGTIAGVVAGLVLILSLFLCVVLHEYGHALTARRFGIGTRHITLLPIGGIALLEAMPRDPRQEIVVALAGPAVNLAIAAALYLLHGVSERPGSILDFGFGLRELVPNLIAANLMLAAFNMLPAFPMDGGRVLRAALSLRLDRVRATRIAAWVGRVLALGLGAIGLMGNPLLVLIAVFVWISAGAEAGAVSADARPDRQPARSVMLTEFRTVARNTPLAAAMDLTLTGTQRDFPVVDGSQIVGVVSQGAIMRGLRDIGPDGQVGAMMGPATIADIRTPITDLITGLRERDGRLACITHRGRLVGVVDLERIADYLRRQASPTER